MPHFRNSGSLKCHFRLEISVAPAEMPNEQQRPVVQVSSSLREQRNDFLFQPRFINWPITAITQTLYSTSVVYSSTVVTRSFILASSLAPGPGLLCLPAGYTVC